MKNTVNNIYSDYIPPAIMKHENHLENDAIINILIKKTNKIITEIVTINEDNIISITNASGETIILNDFLPNWVIFEGQINTDVYGMINPFFWKSKIIFPLDWVNNLYFIIMLLHELWYAQDPVLKKYLKERKWVKFIIKIIKELRADFKSYKETWILKNHNTIEEIKMVKKMERNASAWALKTMRKLRMKWFMLSDEVSNQKILELLNRCLISYEKLNNHLYPWENNWEYIQFYTEITWNKINIKTYLCTS